MPREQQTQARAGSGSSTPNASASQTTTVAASRTRPGHSNLRLRGDEHAPREPQRRIRWAENVVNNEGMGKKKSKICCIYHKPREVGESSSEDSSDSSSDSDSDSDNDDGAARPSQSRGRLNDHAEHSDCQHGHQHGSHRSSKARKPSPNAYEKQPKYAARSSPQS